VELKLTVWLDELCGWTSHTKFDMNLQNKHSSAVDSNLEMNKQVQIYEGEVILRRTCTNWSHWCLEVFGLFGRLKD
jgi:hypothetical protein